MSSVSRSLYVRQQTGTIVAPTTSVVTPHPSVVVPGYGPDVAAVVIVPVVEASVSGPGYTVARELYRCTIDNQIVEDISDLFVDGSVDLNLDRAIKLAATFTLRSPDRVTPYADFLAPYIRIRFDDGREDVYRQVGLFSTKVAPGSYTKNDSIGSYDCDDLTGVLATAGYPNGTSNSAGTNYGTAITTVITNGGISRTNIPATTLTLPTAQSFSVETTRLAKANIYCDQLGWYHLGMDLDGKVSTPGAPRSLAAIEPYRVLTDADVIGATEIQFPGQPIANTVIVINDDAASAPLHATAVNDDPSSPTSTVRVGRSIYRIEKVSGSTTQAALDALAARFLAESRSFYRTAKLVILHDPSALIMHQAVELNLTGERARFNGRWWIRTASLGFTPDRPTVLEINQITDVLNEEVI